MRLAIVLAAVLAVGAACVGPWDLPSGGEPAPATSGAYLLLEPNPATVAQLLDDQLLINLHDCGCEVGDWVVAVVYVVEGCGLSPVAANGYAVGDTSDNRYWLGWNGWRAGSYVVAVTYDDEELARASLEVAE